MEDFDVSKEIPCILVVDDEASVRKIVSKNLEKFGYTSDTACCGREAIHLYNQNPNKYSVVILDYCMPDMNGEETYYELIKRDPAIKIILSSGYLEQSQSKFYEGNSRVAVLSKPYRSAELESSVKKMLSVES